MLIPAAARACESWNATSSPYCHALPDKNWTTLSYLSARQKLSVNQRMDSQRWMRQQNASAAVVVQVGANDHLNLGYVNKDDVVPSCIKRGWQTLLVEPMPLVFQSLQAKYADRLQSGSAGGGRAQVSLLRAAVCESCAQAPSTMWYVDKSSATGNHGSNRSDARCFDHGHFGGFVTEIASLNRAHVENHQYLFKNNPRSCARCSESLRTPWPLPPDCMSRAVHDNVRGVEIRCACLETELAERSIARVTLLMIDAEGFDDRVIRAFPFGSIPVDRVIFEAVHMPNARFRAAITGESCSHNSPTSPELTHLPRLRGTVLSMTRLL